MPRRTADPGRSAAARLTGVEPEQGVAELHRLVLRWFTAHRRVLPWRETRDAYRVLVAEVLAQQTQAARAAHAYGRFLARFPDVTVLAEASPADVLRAWQGLGYNRRAIALHATARRVVAAGGWPRTIEELQALPGVGPYTARAVACFALGQQAAPVDTNVGRVLARVVLGADPARLASGQRQRLADRLLPAGQAWAWTSALMDLGAVHCRPVPRCAGCPLAGRCRWRSLGAEAPRRRPVRQPPFSGTDRRWRGAVVRALVTAPGGLCPAELLTATGAGDAERPNGWFPRLLGRLIADGLVAGPDQAGRYRLPER